MSTSYAYDPNGNKVNVVIKDGKSYLEDGSRVGAGYTVQTGGGIYKMTDQGGVKVDSHNTATSTKKTSGAVSREATDAGKISVEREPVKKGYNKVGNTYVANWDIFADDAEGSYTRTRSDFNAKYDSIIRKIAEYNGVDMSVGEEMLKTNLDQNKGIYAGGGVIATDDWNEMLNDYKILKDSATKGANNPNSYTRDAYGREVRTADVLADIGKNVEGQYRQYPQYSDLGANKSGLTQEELAIQYYGNGAGVAQGGSPVGGFGGGLGGIAGFYGDAAQNAFEAQKAILDRQLATQLTQLEQAYAQAISEGKISVREAQAQFEAQKAEIEQAAYQQAEATKGYGSEMGLANSQQMIGLQQNDNARVNNMNNTNRSDRDKRIADITDRITALTTQKNLAIADANNQYGFGLQGAQAQASQMYNQSIGGLMEKQHFAELEQRYNLENMSMDNIYKLQQMDKDAQLRAEQATINFNRELAAMDYGHQLDMQKLSTSLRNSGVSGSTTNKITNAILTEEQEYIRDMRRYGRSLGLTEAQMDGTQNLENLIRIREEQLGRQSQIDENNLAFELNIQNKAKEAIIMDNINSAMQEVVIPKKPTTTTYFNQRTGTEIPVNGRAMDAYNNAVSAAQAQKEALARALKSIGFTDADISGMTN